MSFYFENFLKHDCSDLQGSPKLDGKVHFLNILYSALCGLFVEKQSSNQILEDDKKKSFDVASAASWRCLEERRYMGIYGEGSGTLGALWPDGPKLNCIGNKAHFGPLNDKCKNGDII